MTVISICSRSNRVTSFGGGASSSSSCRHRRRGCFFFGLVSSFLMMLMIETSWAQQQQQQQQQQESNSDKLTCPLSLLIPFHDGRQIASTYNATTATSGSSSIVTPQNHQRDGLTLLAIALMAIEDFNSRSSTLLPDLSKMLLSSATQCNLYFPPIPTLVDSGYSSHNITTHQDIWLQEGTTCAVIGPIDNLATQQVGQALEGTIIPAISYGATAPSLAEGYTPYTNLVLGNVEWGDTVQVLMEYLKANQHQNVAILYDTHNLDEESYVQVWEEANRDVQLYIVLQLVSQQRTHTELTTRLTEIATDYSGVIDTIVVALNRDDSIQEIAEIADSLGLLSDDYAWIFMDTFVSPQYVEQLTNSRDSSSLSSPLGKLMKRVRLFQLLDGLAIPPSSSIIIDDNINSTMTPSASSTPMEQPLNATVQELQSPKYQNFLKKEWIQRGPNITEQMKVILSQSIGLNETISTFVGGEDGNNNFFFTENLPAYGSSFLYDAIMAVGLTACAGQSIIDSSFDGATFGQRYQFIGYNRSLHVNSLVYGIYEIEEQYETAAENDDAYYKAILIDSNINGEWTEVVAEEDDNNMGEDDPDTRYISAASAAIGMSLASIAILFCMISFGFIFQNRKDRIVTVSQPEFIYMICFGAAMNAISVYFISFDDGKLDFGTLDAFCILNLWFSRIGILIVYCALFSKLWRVEKVSQFRRGQRIEVKDVLGPFVALVLCCLGLLVAWTIVDPPSFVREDYNNILEIGEGSVGFCEENLWFSIPVDIIVLLAVALSFWMSTKTKHIPEDISDSKRVFQTLMSHLILLTVGVILILCSFLFRNNNLSYMARAILIFLISITSVAFLVIPKMYYVRRKRLTGELPPGLQRGRVRVSGLTAGPNANHHHHQYTTSGFTVNQAHSPSASVTLGANASSSLRTDSLLRSTASTNRSMRRLGSQGPSFRGLSGSMKEASFRSFDRASAGDLNASFRSGSNDMNGSTRSLLVDSEETHSPTMTTVDSAGRLSTVSPFLGSPINEEQSEDFLLPIEGDDNEDKEASPKMNGESTSEEHRPPLSRQSSASVELSVVTTIHEEQSGDFSASTNREQSEAFSVPSKEQSGDFSVPSRGERSGDFSVPSNGDDNKQTIHEDE